MRKTHRLEQGSDAWHAHRATPGMVNASEVAAIMGICRHTTRSELLRRKATGIDPEHSLSTERLFAKGHEDEALARPYAEELIGDDLSALVMTDTIDGILFSASLDGITQDHSITFEHKSFSMVLADSLDAGVIPPAYLPQMEVGLMVSGARRCLFMASKNGDAETARHLWFDSNPNLRKLIIQACKQFLIDLENYQHVEATVAPVAAPIRDLPAIVVNVSGALAIETNFSVWGVELNNFIACIPEKPATDQEFADCKAAVVALKKAEEQLDAEEARVLSQVPSIDDMKREKKLLWELSRTTRLALEKLVIARDIAVKNEIIQVGQDGFRDHMAALNKHVGGYMPNIQHSFSEAIKNKRSYTSMREAVNDALANAKCASNEIADRINANRLEMIGELDWSFLFPDFAAVCTKARDDFSALLMARIAKHNEAEAVRIAAAKKAEEARIAAAVEAERRAGEARAAAEAERITKEAARADAQAQAQAANDQRGKADAGVGLSPDDRAQPEAASTAPLTARTAMAAHHDVNDEAIIDDYLRLLGISPIEKKALRMHLVKFVRYQAALEALVMV